MKLYEVKAKCGHVGRKFYALKTFAVKAENGREAARITRQIPRVKHHHKDAIKEVREIDEIRFAEIIILNEYDPYFFCECVQDQRSYTDPDIYPEERYEFKEKTEVRYKAVFNGKTMIKKPKRYIKNYELDFEEAWAY